MCVGNLVAYLSEQHTNETNMTAIDAYWYASGIVLTTALNTIIFYPVYILLIKTACKVRVACSGLIYQKALQIRNSSIEDGQNSQIINMLSTDLSKFDNAFAYVHNVWKSPLEAMIFFVFIYKEIGISALVGILFLISFIPLQGKCN